MKRVIIAATLMATMGLSGAVLAESHVDPAISGAIDARQAHMDLYAFNLGVLGGMAQGKVDYDADAASAAASNLAALSQLSQAGYWLPGSDTSVEGSNALPAIWENIDDVIAKGGDLVTAAQAMEVAAGNGLEALQGAMGPLGGTCSACHRAYRQRN